MTKFQLEAQLFFQKIKDFYFSTTSCLKNLFEDYYEESIPQIPLIFDVKNTSNTTNVNLFDACLNRFKPNFGNDQNIEFNYHFNGYFGGGKDGMIAMMSRSESNPLKINKIRVTFQNETKFFRLNISKYDFGGSETYPILFSRKKDQLDTYSLEQDLDELTIDGFVRIDFTLDSNSEIKFYLFQSDKVSKIKKKTLWSKFKNLLLKIKHIVKKMASAY